MECRERKAAPVLRLRGVGEKVCIKPNAFGNALGQGIVGQMQASATQDRLKNTLDKAGVKYSVDANGAVQPDITQKNINNSTKVDADPLGDFITKFDDDPQKKAAYYAAVGQGLAIGDAEKVANVVDTKRTVDAMNDVVRSLSADDPLRGDFIKTGKVFTDAILSKDVYFKNSIPEFMPDGVGRMSNEDIAAKGLTYKNADFENKSSDYFGSLYQNTNSAGATTYIYANRGTEGMRDWQTNATNAFGFKDAQFAHAVDVGRGLYKELNGNLSFTGHSLGGGLATAQAMAVPNGRAITFNAEGVSDGTIRRLNLNTASVEQRITAFNVNGEMLSRLQDSPLSSAIAVYYGTVPKNALAVAGVVGDLFSGQKPDFSSFGLPLVASAAGTRVAIPAVTLQGQSLGVVGRLTNTVSLHYMDSALKSLQTQLGQNGTLPSNYLINIH